MFILLDKPHISEFLINTIKKNNISAIDTGKVLINGEIKSINKSLIIDQFKKDPKSKIYTTSENAISWIAENLSFTELPQKINLFKDKVVFRDLTKEMYPKLFYKEVAFEDIESMDISDLPKPFIIKPSVGFFSLGVHKVFNQSSWDTVKKEITENIDEIRTLYPEVVLKTKKFIIEEEIKGVEYAIDAYYDEVGKPVILGIMQHYFASKGDVSDRVYITSTEVIKMNFKSFEEFLSEIGKKVGLINFPVHVEIRIDNKGNLVPIEVNPVRFGGWCTSAELANYAFNVNSYENYIFGRKPEWNEIIETNSTDIFSLIILDNSTGFEGKDIESFNFDQLLSEFKNPLELRKFNHKEYPIFGFLFVRIEPDEHNKLDKILKSDLKEYITLC